MKNVLSVINVVVMLLLAGFLVFVMMSPVALVVALLMAVPVLLARWAYRPGARVRIRRVAALVNMVHAAGMGIWIVGLLRGLSQGADDYGIGMGMIVLAAVWMALCGTNAFVLSPSFSAAAGAPEEPGSPSAAEKSLPPEATPLETWLHRIGMARYVEEFGRHGIAIEDLDAMTLERMCEIVHDRDDARSIMDEIIEGSHVDHG